MCWIAVKEAGKKWDFGKINKAQEWNEDGYGAIWWEDGELNTFKTMNFKRFKALLSTLKDNKAVLHLRNTSKGTTCIDNNHPFKIPSGYMVHNGTVGGMVCDTNGGSDTKALATLISQCNYNYINDIEPLIKHIIGNKINRLVFFEDDGEITIVNEDLGMWEEGIWYSNNYHKKEVYIPTNYKHNAQETKYFYDPRTKTWNPYKTLGTESKSLVPKTDEKKEVAKSNPPKQGASAREDKKLTRVFVYGTLKQGFSNHYLLEDSEFIGEASSVSKWSMIGTGMAFPYLLEKDYENGKIIKGEVYEIDNETLRRLDRLEGTPTHYKQENIYVSYNNGESSQNVLTYVRATPIHEKYKPHIEYIDNFIKDVRMGVVA